jgi:hypothetical protein
MEKVNIDNITIYYIIYKFDHRALPNYFIK